jgi:hypothetical protein
VNYLDPYFVAALHSGVLSFDTNSNARVLAACARLKVFPHLNAAEKARLVR